MMSKKHFIKIAEIISDNKAGLFKNPLSQKLSFFNISALSTEITKSSKIIFALSSSKTIWIILLVLIILVLASELISFNDLIIINLDII